MARMAQQVARMVGQGCRRSRDQGRLRRAGERGAQALEYMALGTAVSGMLGAAGLFLHDHGAAVGGALLNQLKSGLGQ